MGLVGWLTRYNPDKDIPDLSGKVFFVTGGNTGLGKETILQIAKHNPSHIYLGARTQSKAEAAIADITSQFSTSSPAPPITYIPLDLTSFASIKSAASSFQSQSPRLDVLVNNAGIMGTPLGATADGYEIQFGTNHMGHALLTKLLLPTLQATAAADEKAGGTFGARVVNVSSYGNQMALGGLTTDKAAMDKSNTWVRYGNSKLANILHAKGLAVHHGADAAGIVAVSLHPGVIYTDLYNPGVGTNFLVTGAVGLFSRIFLKNVAQGAYTQIWAATAPKKDLTNGAFYDGPGAVRGGSGNARDDKQRDTLWDFTESELKAKGY